MQRRRVIPGRQPRPSPRPSAAASLDPIRKDIEIAAKRLSDINDQNDFARTENQRLNKEKASLQRDISQERLTLDDLRSQNHRASQDLLALNADIATTKASHADTLRNLETEIQTLKVELATLQPLHNEIETLKSIKSSLTEELNFLEKNIAFIRGEQATESAQMEAKRAEIAHEIENLNAIIEKNERIALNIEQDRHKLEIYVRRLQRYYDETGVKLSILPEFQMTYYGDHAI